MPAIPELEDGDLLNSVEATLLQAVENMAAGDPDFEQSTFVKGYPIFPDTIPLARPIVAVWIEDADLLDTGYDEVFAVSDAYTSDPDFELWRGTFVRATTYAEVYTSQGTPTIPSPSGGANVAKRIAGKIATRLMLTPECLGGELEILRGPTVRGPFEPIDSNRPDLLFYRVELLLGTTVLQRFGPA